MSGAKESQAGEKGSFKPINYAQSQNLPGCVLFLDIRRRLGVMGADDVIQSREGLEAHERVHGTGG